MPKRPPDDLPEEDMVNTGQRRAAESATVESEPLKDEAPGATAFVRVDQIPATPPAADENPGATAFVRLDADGAAAPLPPPRRAEKAPLAPKKGLQVSIPDDEPAPPPPPKKKIAPPPLDKKGRRGAWWDEEQPKEKEPEPPAEDDNPGATAFVRVEPKPKPAPPPEPEPEIETYRPVPADDYAGHVKEGPPAWKVWLGRAVTIAIVFFVLGLAGAIGGYIYISREIPTFDSVRDYHPFVASKVVANDGSLVGQFYRERRTVVKMDQIPRVLVQAVVSAEDKDFYKHPGFNVLALLRAVVVDVASGRKRLGASTITQQVVKNFFLTSEKKWKRKLKEVLLSLRLEKNLSKDDILFLYLNQINFGKAHYGVEEAALYYFNKHVQDIDLGEAAILAGLPQNPSRINPRRHPDRAKGRQKYVLQRMLANKYISDDDYQREIEKPIVLPPPPPEPPGAWYLDEVRRQLVAQFGESAVDTSGMQVEVAMDPRLQSAAEYALQEGLRIVDKRQGWRGPEIKLDENRMEAYRTALGRRLAAVAQTTDQVWVVDLEGIHAAAVRKFAGKKPAKKQADADDADVAAEEIQVSSVAPDVIARAGKPRPLMPDEVYSGIVTQVLPREAVVELAPGVAGSVPFSSMTWARPFKPERATPLPRAPSDVVSVGDVVPVRVQRMQTTRDGSGRLRVARLDFTLEQTPKVQGAFVGMDLKSRGVVALVGGYDTALSSFNRATQAKRQPGSSFKPFLYAAALDSGKYTPTTKMDDSPEVINDPWTGKAWKPQNFEKDEFAGPITLRKALAESKNTVAVKLLLDVGLDKVRTMARAAGIRSEIPQSYTAALGTGEVGVLEEVNGYATIASEGRRAEPVLIRKVLSRDGNVLLSAQGTLEQTMKPETAYLTADLMRSVIEDSAGTAHSLTALGRPMAGKTGTASEHRDAWFVGFTPSLLAGGWVGFDTHEMLGAFETGGHAAGPMWMMWMRAALANQPREEWPQPPAGVTVVKINRNTGALAGENDPYAVREVFMAGTEPTQTSEEQPGQEDWYQAPQR
jgi:penicillin-binding protein 1A